MLLGMGRQRASRCCWRGEAGEGAEVVQAKAQGCKLAAKDWVCDRLAWCMRSKEQGDGLGSWWYMSIGAAILWAAGG